MIKTLTNEMFNLILRVQLLHLYIKSKYWQIKYNSCTKLQSKILNMNLYGEVDFDSLSLPLCIFKDTHI